MSKSRNKTLGCAAVGTACPAVLTGSAAAAQPVSAAERFWRSHRLLPLFLVLPFLVLYWMVPLFSRLTIGNDYTLYSIGAQMELLFSLRHGTFPLYWPRPGDGFSSAALTLGQLYHPITWIAGLVPGYWSGHALEINTLLRLLSLGFTHYVLFRFLRRLALKGSLALLLSFLAVYNLRMLDLMRYGASLENYTGYLLLLAATGFDYLRPSRVWGMIWIAGATYLLVVGGHPQMMYLAMIGAGVTILLMPFYLAVMAKVAPPALKRLGGYYLRVFGAMGIGMVLAAAYVIPFYFDYLHIDTMRQGLAYQFSLGFFQNSYLGTVNTFLRPYVADVHGNFGGSVLITLAALLPLLALARVRIPVVIWGFWAFFALGLAYQLGSHTPVHYLFWRYVPFAASFREPGRMAIVHPFTVMLLLAWLVQLPPLRWRIPRLAHGVPPYTLLAALTLLLLVGYHLVPLSHFKVIDHFAPMNLTSFVESAETHQLSAIPSSMFVLVFWAALASLILLILHGLAGARRPWLEIGLLLAVALQSGAVLRYGTWLEFRKPTPTYAELCESRRQDFACKQLWAERTEHSRAATLHEQQGLQRRQELARLHARYFPVASQGEACQRLLGNGFGSVLFVENFDRATPPASPQPAAGAVNRLSLDFATVNRLVFKAACATPAFLALTLPYAEGRWTAAIDGKAARIYRANGMEQAVYLPAGESRVEFRYGSPSFAAGLLISILTACALVWFMLTTLNSRRLRVVLMALAVLLFVALLIVWHHSLYSGQGLGTVYNVVFPAS